MNSKETPVTNESLRRRILVLEAGLRKTRRVVKDAIGNLIDENSDFALKDLKLALIYINDTIGEQPDNE